MAYLLAFQKISPFSLMRRSNGDKIDRDTYLRNEQKQSNRAE